MDKRLKEVHQTDITEGRINQDFLDWLKTKGTSWLLVVVVALFVYAAIVRWQNYRSGYQSEAWAELSKAVLPSNYEDVAEKYGDVGSVAHLARMRGAEKLLAAVQTGRTLGADAATAAPLTDEIRTDYLDRADRLYNKILESDDGASAMTLMMTSALEGRAAVAECRGKAEDARQLYEQAIKRCEADFPPLAERIRKRSQTIDESAKPITLPTREQTAAANKPSIPPLDQVWSDPWVDELLNPKP